jgi:signal transduction histidine kinase
LEKDTASLERKQILLFDIADSYYYVIPDSALIYFNKALEIALLDKNREREAYFRMKIGGVYYLKGEYSFALENFLNGLDISREIYYKRGIALGLNGLGIVYNMHQQERQAIERHKESIAICIEIGDSLLWAVNLHNIGLSLDQLKERDSAILIADSTIHLLKHIGNTLEQFRIFNFKGWTYFNMRDYRKAEAEFMRVIRDSSYDNKWEIGYALLGLASVSQKLGDIEQSIEYGLQSLKLAREIGALWDLQQTTKVLAESYAFEQNYEEAFRYQLLFKAYSDSIFNQTKNAEINYMQLRYHEGENARLMLENELKQQRIDKKNLQIFGYAIGLGLLAILAFILYKQIAQKTRMNQKLAQLNAEKDKFFSIIAHDLKSPFNSILGFSNLLVEQIPEKDYDGIEKYAKIIQQSSKRAMNLLMNLMEWSRSQTGGMKFNPADYELASLIDNTTLLLSSSAEQKSINISNTSPLNVTVFIDKAMISTVLRNLISNAIKYSNSGGEVRISAEVKTEGVLVSVGDTGVGISKANIEKIFRIDESFSTPGTNNENGTGLGLILCKEFVEKHNGEIWVESKEGLGSTFSFTIPKHVVEEDEV